VCCSVIHDLEDALDDDEGVLQCVAVCCSVVQCIAECCSVIDNLEDALDDNEGVLQCVIYCSVL